MSARPDKWMPWFISDFDRATGHLTDSENLAYRRILEFYWGNGAPPDDDRRLAAIVRKSMSQWARLRPALIGFFSVVENRWQHKRAEAEWIKAVEAHKQRVAASASAARKRNKNNEKSHRAVDRPDDRPDDRAADRAADRTGVRTDHPTTTTVRVSVPKEQRDPNDRGATILPFDRQSSAPIEDQKLDRKEAARLMAELAAALGSKKRLAGDPGVDEECGPESETG